MSRQTHTGYFIFAGFAALLAWLLSKGGNSLLHESVSAKIVTPQGTVTSDPATGAPQYDHRFPNTVPEQEAFAISPIGHSCPEGYRLWRDAADGSYHCLPT